MPMLDVFNSDAFNTISLTEAINILPFVPSRIGAMGLFVDEGITTVQLMVEEKNGVLTLLPTKPRGAPSNLNYSEKRTVRSFVIPHIPVDDTVLADDVLGIRAFGSENQLEAVAQKVNDKLGSMRQDMEVTHEHLRIGALHGNILDADGSTVIYNLFTEFGVSETEVDFELDDATTNVRAKCLDVKDAVQDALGMAPYTRIHALCGTTFFRNLIDHSNVKTAYERWRDGEALRNDPTAGFTFADITFEEYRGSVAGVDFIDDEHARFFPQGTPGLFKTYYAPADFMEAVNTVGKSIYAKSEPLDLNRGRRLHVQSNPLPICHRPAALVKGVDH